MPRVKEQQGGAEEGGWEEHQGSGFESDCIAAREAACRAGLLERWSDRRADRVGRLGLAIFTRSFFLPLLFDLRFQRFAVGLGTWRIGD